MRESKELIDQVLRGIGRNVLNLQKMEGMLKLIMSSTGEVGSTTDAAQTMQDLERSIKNRRKEINRLSMGRLVDSLSKSLRPSASEQREGTDSGSRYCIEVSFYFEDKDFADQLSQALREIVRERNELIHKRLIFFNPKSDESCRELLGELEQQHSRLKPQYEALSAICLFLKDYFVQLKDYVDSESFVDDVKRANDGSE